MRTTYRDIRNGLMNGQELGEILEKLQTIKNSYADDIALAFISGDITKGLSLLNASIKFEIAMESKIMAKESEICQNKVRNLINIHDVCNKRAKTLQKKRNKRLKDKAKRTWIKDSGLIKVNA